MARIGLVLWFVLCTARGAPATEFTYPFGERALDLTLFRPSGNPRCMRIEPKGLRISLPADHGSKPPIGLVPRFPVRGDFEITMAFDILEVDQPTAGNGAGVSIWITMASATKEAATIARLVRPSGEQVFTAHRASTPAGGKRQHRGTQSDSTALSGQLRLVRTDEMLSYQVAEGDSDAFREFYQTELGVADLEQVRFAADSGGAETAVDVRIPWVSIHASDAPKAATQPARRIATWKILAASGIGVVVLVAVVGAWVCRSSGGRPMTPKPKQRNRA